jgi:predicted enzyme related to lactoylglutathione lyase
MEKMKLGRIGWIDLTVDDASGAREFYEAVVGWTSSPVSMGDYSDYNMLAGDGEPVAGVCHARGGNAGLPAVWTIYLVVEDLERSLEACRERGGRVLREPRSAGSGSYALIADPAGAVCALFQEESAQ